MNRISLSALSTVASLACLSSLALAQGGPGGPPPVPPLPATAPAPAQNPTTAQKAVLGKILFFEEQLSSDNTTACATCHISSSGGGDPRSSQLVVNPGPDGMFGTGDDRSGSPGVSTADSSDDYAPHPDFGFDVQVTGRTAPTMIGSAFFPLLFWDGRATGQFVDPVSGAVILPGGAALESQAVGPPVSDVEMAHASRDWTSILSKLAAVEPMRLASNLTPDIVTALTNFPSYPELFQNAFGTPDITAPRVAMAIAAYERTLIPNQTPWDAFNAGNLNALTPNQRQGLQAFAGPGRCGVCHTPPLFSDGSFRNVGVRSPVEDLGRQEVTGNPADRGRFKVPTLRNVGLREVFFHNGQFTTLGQVVNFYNVGGVFPDNRDPVLDQIALDPIQRQQIVDLLTNGLTDPRVANELPPFDRPTLHSEQLRPNPALIGGAVAGSGGFVPRMIASSPPADGLPGFKLGLANGLGGAVAVLTLRTPAGAHLAVLPNQAAVFATSESVSGRVRLSSTGAGNGFTTYHLDIPENAGLSGMTIHAQWHVFDRGAPGGIAHSEVAELVML